MGFDWKSVGWFLLTGPAGLVIKSAIDKSGDSSSESRKLEQARERAEEENRQKREQAQQAAHQRKILEQNRAHAQRLINNYSLNLTPDALIASPPAKLGASLGVDLALVQREKIAIAAYKASDKFTKQSQQIKQIQNRLKEIKLLECELTEFVRAETKMSNNNVFLKALEKFQSDFKYVCDKEQDLVAIKSALVKELTDAGQVKNSSLNEQHPLFKLAEQVKFSIEQSVMRWDAKLEEASPMRALSEQFADRVILLVFGKVNAGKSSFCNYLTDLFTPEQIKRFRFENGQVKYFNGTFVEGVTETTAQIQGVELGANLVLLDSPGLHSIVDKNGDLTRRYTDSADGILWLTPSSSPGQVQELEDLKLELEKKKPLQPIITKSDILVEDFCDDLQQFIQKVENKTLERRQLQQDDVHSRVIALGGIENLKDAVSISVHAYKELKATSPTALQDAGLQTLFERLVVLVNEANQYKIVKAKQQMVNFLDGEIVRSLDEEIMPQVRELQQLLENTTNNLRQKQHVLTSKILDNVLCEVPLIIDKHMTNRDKEAISWDLNEFIEEQLSSTLQEELSGYVNNIQRVTANMSSDHLGDFTDITIDIEQVSGSRKGAGAEGAGAAAGTVFGTIIGSAIPGVGTAIGAAVGGVIGGLLGNMAGKKFFIETNTVTETVGVSPDQLILTACNVVREQLPALVNNVFDDVQESFNPLQQYVDSIILAVDDCVFKTQKLKV